MRVGSNSPNTIKQTTGAPQGCLLSLLLFTLLFYDCVPTYSINRINTFDTTVRVLMTNSEEAK